MAEDVQTPVSQEESFRSFLSATGMPSRGEVEKKGTELFEKHKAARQPLVEQSDALMKKVGDLNAQIERMQSPKPPELEKLPEIQDSQFKDPTQALGSIASVLAMLGSLKTRAPLTAALNSAAASMQAFHQGDKERVELERKKWRDNLERGIRQNHEEMQKYTAALQSSNFDLSKAQAQFRVIAAQNEHTQMMAAIESGDYKAQMDIIDGGLTAGFRAAQLHVTDQYRRALLADRKQKQTEKIQSGERSTERAVAIIDEMQNLLDTSTGITGAAGMVRRPMESVKSMLGGDEGKSHKYESLARELQNTLRQTEEFHYKGRTLSREVADRDVIVRGLKLGDTDQISSEQLNHLRNMLTGEGTGFQPPAGASAGIEYNGYRFPSQKALDDYKAAAGVK